MDGVPKITFNCIPKYIKNGTLIQRKKRAKISKLVKQRKKFPPAICQLILVYLCKSECRVYTSHYKCVKV